jgi:hypothetical protein
LICGICKIGKGCPYDDVARIHIYINKKLSWDYSKLFLIGSQDKSSILSTLPLEILKIILNFAAIPHNKILIEKRLSTIINEVSRIDKARKLEEAEKNKGAIIFFKNVPFNVTNDEFLNFIDIPDIEIKKFFRPNIIRFQYTITLSITYHNIEDSNKAFKILVNRASKLLLCKKKIFVQKYDPNFKK